MRKIFFDFEHYYGIRAFVTFVLFVLLQWQKMKHL